MDDPPDRGKANNQLVFTTNKNKTLKNNTNAPKYLVISRIENTETLVKVSPFLIKRVIDSVCGGEVELCKKIKSGNILIKTKTHAQATKLITLTSFTPTIKVEVTEHNTLNTTKGVIFSRELKGIPEEIIKEELKHQNVSEVRKIMKKMDQSLIETGLLIITFDHPTLPDDLLIGYEKVKLRPYIPLPLRCTKCLKYGHSQRVCNNTQVCVNCAKASHTNPELNEKCTNPTACSSCIQQGINNTNHNALNKICPIFIKEREIQAIITLEKVDRRKAISTYEDRHPQNTSYAKKAAIIPTSLPTQPTTHTPTTTRTPKTDKTQATSSNNTNNNPSHSSILPHNSPPPHTSTSTQREQTDYSDVLLNSTITPENTIQKIVKENKIRILPKNISNRTKKEIKKINKTTKRAKRSTSPATLNNGDSESSESMATD